MIDKKLTQYMIQEDTEVYKRLKIISDIEINKLGYKEEDYILDNKIQDLNDYINKIEENLNNIEKVTEDNKKLTISFKANISKEVSIKLTQKLKEEKIWHILKKIRNENEIYMKIIMNKKQVKKKYKIIRDIADSCGFPIHQISNRIKGENLKRIKYDKLKIISININKISNKILLFQNLVVLDDPDIILIQETHRKNKEGKFDLPGYDIFEKTSTETIGDNGLIIAVKRLWKGSYTLTRLDSNIATIKMVNNNETIDISNIYIPHESKKKEWLKKATNIISNNTKAILVGDWNTEKKEIVEILNKEGITHRVCDSTIKGTRKVKEEETNRIIDYMITNSEDLIIEETYLKHWDISDHYPVEIIVKWIPEELKRENNKFIFDRKRIKEPEIKQRIANYNYLYNMERETDPQKIFTIFYEEMKEVLNENKIIKKVKDRKLIPNRKIMKLITERRFTTDKESSEKISKEIREIVKEIKKEKYNKFIMEGCEYLKKAQTREAWNWLKKKSGLNTVLNKIVPQTLFWINFTKK